VVAIKRMSLERSEEGFPISALSEIKLLSHIDHPNIVRLMDVAIAKYAPSERLFDDGKNSGKAPLNYPWNFFMVCEYAEHSLAGLLQKGVSFKPSEIKFIIKQILDGLSYLHEKHIMHRDLKSSNILVNSNAEIKLADFGMSTRFVPNTVQKGQKVVTLWYRAPEILLGAEYTEAIDMWAAGCVLGELILGEALFRGKSEQEQLNLILQALSQKKGKVENGGYLERMAGCFEKRAESVNNFWEKLKLAKEYLIIK